MERKKWDRLLGRLREGLLQRGRDPELILQIDREERAIRLPDETYRNREWLTFNLDSTEYEERDPREIAADLIGISLGREESPS